MVKETNRLSKLILWEIILLFIIIIIITYAPMIVEIDSLGEILSKLLQPILIIIFILIVTKIFVTILSNDIKLIVIVQSFISDNISKSRRIKSDFVRI